MATNLNNIGEYIGIVPKSGFDLVEIVEKGLPAESVGLLRDKGLTFTEVSEVIIPPRTLKRRTARGENLSHEETDRLLLVARIIGFAEHVFGNRVKALLWLRDPDDRLGDRTALSYSRPRLAVASWKACYGRLPKVCILDGALAHKYFQRSGGVEW